MRASSIYWRFYSNVITVITSVPLWCDNEQTCWNCTLLYYSIQQMGFFQGKDDDHHDDKRRRRTMSSFFTSFLPSLFRPGSMKNEEKKGSAGFYSSITPFTSGSCTPIGSNWIYRRRRWRPRCCEEERKKHKHEHKHKHKIGSRSCRRRNYCIIVIVVVVVSITVVVVDGKDTEKLSCGCQKCHTNSHPSYCT